MYRMRRNFSDAPQLTCRFLVSEGKVVIKKSYAESQRKKNLSKARDEVELVEVPSKVTFQEGIL